MPITLEGTIGGRTLAARLTPKIVAEVTPKIEARVKAETERVMVATVLRARFEMSAEVAETLATRLVDRFGDQAAAKAATAPTVDALNQQVDHPQDPIAE